jgi:DeoR family deoxyribose operon repressor
MLESPEGIQLINRTRASKVFLSAAGVSEQLGITCANQYEIESKKAIINAALSRILLVDSSKFGKIRPALFAQLSDIDAIVTDDDIPTEWRDIIDKLKITLHIAHDSQIQRNKFDHIRELPD